MDYSKMDKSQIMNKNDDDFPCGYFQWVRFSDKATLPHKEKWDAGWDIHPIEKVTIEPGKIALIKTDVGWACYRSDLYAKVHDRSSVGYKTKLNTKCGVIDAGYRGKIGIVVHNTGDTPLTFTPEKAVCQIIVQEYETYGGFIEISLEDFNKLPPTDRGAQGYGSTDKKVEKADKVEDEEKSN